MGPEPGQQEQKQPPESQQGDRRLDSWKAIADYLGVSDRTARRYEAESGLPVHRLVLDKRGSVYALVGELDEWRRVRTVPPASAPSSAPPVEPSEPASTPPPSRWTGLRGAALVLIPVCALLAWGVFRRAATPVLLRPVPFSTGGELEFSPNISPDGAWVTYASFEQANPTATATGGNGRIWVRRWGQDDATPIVQDPDGVYSPVWSPDGSRIAYLRQPAQGPKELWITTRDGRNSTRQTGVEVFAPPMRDIRGSQIAWINNQELVLPMRPEGAAPGLFRLSLQGGGTPVRLTSAAPPLLRDTTPRLDGKRRTLAFLRERIWQSRIVCLVPIDNPQPDAREPECLTQLGSVASLDWVPNASELLITQGNIEAMLMLRVSVPECSRHTIPLVDTSALELALHPSGGRAIYTRIRTQVNLLLIDTQSPTTQAKLWNASTRMDHFGVISPDGKQVVFSSNRLGGFDLWLAPLSVDDGKLPVRLTNFNGAGSTRPLAWSPDGKSIVAVTDLPQQRGERYFLMPVTGGPERTLPLPANGSLTELRFTPAGDAIEFLSTGKPDFWEELPLHAPGAASRLTRRPAPKSALPFCSTRAGDWSMEVTESRVDLAFTNSATGVKTILPPVANLNGKRPSCTPDGRYVMVTVFSAPQLDLMQLSGLEW